MWPTGGAQQVIVGWSKDFALGPDTSDLPLLGPGFLSANGDNHPYSAAGVKAEAIRFAQERHAVNVRR